MNGSGIQRALARRGLGWARIGLAALLLGFTGSAAGLAAEGPDPENDPGFDCKKAATQIEHAICSWSTVAAADRAMAAAYRAAIAAQPDPESVAAVRAGQRRWLAARDRRCALDAVTPDPTSEEGLSPEEQGQLLCLQAAYPPRIAQLQDIVAPGASSAAWLGEWAGAGAGQLTAKIRRGSAKPEFLVIDLVTGMEGCSGAVTVFGKPEGDRLHAKSYDPNDPQAPVCAIDFELGPGPSLRTETAGPCEYYHGGACDFSGNLTRP